MFCLVDDKGFVLSECQIAFRQCWRRTERVDYKFVRFKTSREAVEYAEANTIHGVFVKTLDECLRRASQRR